MTKQKNTDEKCECHSYCLRPRKCSHCNPEKQSKRTLEETLETVGKIQEKIEKQGDDWEREFRKRFVRQPAHDMILVVADVEPVIDFIRQVEKQTRDDVIEEIFPLVDDIFKASQDLRMEYKDGQAVDLLVGINRLHDQLKQKTKE